MLAGRPVLTWGFLVCATLTTLWLAERSGLSAQRAVSIVFLIALLKGRMIILHYMNLREVARAWRFAFELWVFGVPIGILTLWLLSGTACN